MTYFVMLALTLFQGNFPHLTKMLVVLSGVALTFEGAAPGTKRKQNMWLQQGHVPLGLIAIN